MTKMFSKLTSDTLEETQDRLGGGMEAIATDAYDATIKMMYVTTAASGAMAMNIVVDIAGKEHRFQEWITNKKGENFYPDKQDAKKKQPLPGFVTVEDICLLTTGEGLSEQDVEEKTVKIYNFEEKKDIPTPVPVVVNTIGKQIKIGVLREITQVQKKDDSGEYVDQFNEDGSPKTRTQNQIDKIFHPETGRTVNEYRHEVETAEFLTAWLERNKGKDRNRVKDSKGAAAGASGSGRPGAPAGGEKKKSLFGAK